MEEAETHHDRPPLAGVVRELESQPSSSGSATRIRTSQAARQAVGVVVE